MMKLFANIYLKEGIAKKINDARNKKVTKVLSEDFNKKYTLEDLSRQFEDENVLKLVNIN